MQATVDRLLGDRLDKAGFFVILPYVELTIRARERPIVRQFF